jgi:hypothetical protein
VDVGAASPVLFAIADPADMSFRWMRPIWRRHHQAEAKRARYRKRIIKTFAVLKRLRAGSKPTWRCRGRRRA